MQTLNTQVCRSVKWTLSPRYRQGRNGEALAGANFSAAVTNRSLYFDKFCPIGTEQEKSRYERGVRGESKWVPSVRDEALNYLCSSAHFESDSEPRRFIHAHLANSGRHTVAFQATLKSRMMVNMAGTVIENAGLCLDRHFGMPFIPGSALKGLALRGARVERTSDDGHVLDADITRVFGEQDPNADVARKGLVCFLPAYPTHPAQLELDVMTGHHGGYYRGDSQLADSPDTESPIPVKFPVIKAGTEFCFVVCGRGEADQALVEQAARWLINGITELGVGAKTAAGYGWFHYDAESEQKREAEEQRRRQLEQEAQRQAEAEAKRLAEMTPEQQQIAGWLKLDDGTLAGMVKSLAQADEATQRAFLCPSGKRACGAQPGFHTLFTNERGERWTRNSYRWHSSVCGSSLRGGVQSRSGAIGFRNGCGMRPWVRPGVMGFMRFVVP